MGLQADEQSLVLEQAGQVAVIIKRPKPIAQAAHSILVALLRPPMIVDGAEDLSPPLPAFQPRTRVSRR